MFLFHDFYPLWAAGRIAFFGGNPYDDAAIVHELQKAGVTSLSFPGGFHNPPWTIWLFSLFGALPLSAAKAAWLFLLLASVAVAVKRSLELLVTDNEKSELQRKIPLFIVLAGFYPLGKLLLVGQSSFIPLLGFTYLLWGVEKRRYVLAGAAVSLTLFKPQLFIPLYLLLAVWSAKERHWRLFWGGVLAFSLQIALSLALRPAIFNDFLVYIPSFYSERSAGLQVTIGHLLAAITGKPEMVTIGAVTGTLAAFFFVLTFNGDILYRLSIATITGLLVAPYAWSHDHILLLFPYLTIVHRLYCRSRAMAPAIVTLAGALSFIYVSADLRTHEQAMLVWPLFILLRF